MTADELSRRIAANLAEVKQQIADSAQGRAIRLVCVTKYASDLQVDGLLSAGATELGESHLPQATERFARLRAAGHVFTAHLLGAQQSRKVKAIPDSCDLFQALDRPKTAELLNSELASRHTRLPLLLEVNVDSEPQKQGYLPETLEQSVSELLTNSPQLELQGLMAIPQARQMGQSASQWERQTRASFGQMRRMFDRIYERFPEMTAWSTLSMGMSQDFNWAIAEGSTMVRVGSALFRGLEG